MARHLALVPATACSPATEVVGCCPFTGHPCPLATVPVRVGDLITAAAQGLHARDDRDGAALARLVAGQHQRAAIPETPLAA